MTLCGSRLQRRLSAADIFGRRFYNMEDDSGRHDAVNYGLQPANKKYVQLHGFPFENKQLTASPLAEAEATDKWAVMSVMMLLFPTHSLPKLER